MRPTRRRLEVRKYTYLPRHIGRELVREIRTLASIKLTMILGSFGRSAERVILGMVGESLLLYSVLFECRTGVVQERLRSIVIVNGIRGGTLWSA